MCGSAPLRVMDTLPNYDLTNEEEYMKNTILTIVIFVFTIGIFTLSIDGINSKADAEGAKTLQNAITKATVQCYAIEGRYPSSVEYLVENYGIQIDEDKYAVFYEGFASNIMPDITVTEI